MINTVPTFVKCIQLIQQNTTVQNQKSTKFIFPENPTNDDIRQHTNKPLNTAPPNPLTPTPQPKRVGFALPPAAPTQQELDNALQLRASQVDEINASDRPPRALRIPWPTCSDSTLKAWEARAGIFKTMSQGHLGTQKRLLFLLDLPPARRFEAFELECWRRTLSPTTAETYYGAYLGAVAIMESVTLADKKAAALLKKRANAYPTRFPTPMTAADVRQLLTLAPCAHHATLIAFSWTCGQRLSDMILLRTNNVDITAKTITVKVCAGKVLHHIPPYVLALQRHPQTLNTIHALDVAERFVLLVEEARACGRPYLIIKDAEEETRNSARQSCSELLDLVSPDLEVRSIRRGGLQHLAATGTPTNAILLLSQHRDEAMLMRYLDNGKRSAARTSEIMAMTSQTMEAVMHSGTHHLL